MSEAVRTNAQQARLSLTDEGDVLCKLNVGPRILTASTIFLAALLCGLLAQAQTLDGLWLSDGGGMLFDIKGETVHVFEITSISCLPSWQAMGSAATANGHNETVFTENAGMRRFTLDRAPNIARFQSDCSTADILFRKMQHSPKSYTEPIDNTPQADYAIFWQTFAENYPFFKLHHVDWADVDREFRPRVTAETSPGELYRILRSMIEPLHDAHTSLKAPDLKQQFRGSRADRNPLRYDDWVQSAVIIASKYVRGDMQYFCKNQISFGMLDNSIGYMKIWSFANYTDAPDYAKQLQALELALDTIFRDSGKLRGLVIDVRLNTGGYDGLGLSIASRLAREDYLAYSVKTVNSTNGILHFTQPQAVWVHAGTRPGFHGNVVVLTGHNCVSAGETFVMSLMGRKPTVCRIGENTQGVFSDVLTRHLPNGWSFGLPNEIYLTEGGNAFDGSGVPPSLSVPVFPREDFQNKQDTALEKAVQVLSVPGN